MRTFLPHDQPHALGPSVQDVAGELGDPRPVPDLAVRLDGRRPGRGRNTQDVLADRVVITMPTE
jgi:hypothetical protein